MDSVWTLRREFVSSGICVPFFSNLAFSVSVPFFYGVTVALSPTMPAEMGRREKSCRGRGRELENSEERKDKRVNSREATQGSRC